MTRETLMELLDYLECDERRGDVYGVGWNDALVAVANAVNSGWGSP